MQLQRRRRSFLNTATITFHAHVFAGYVWLVRVQCTVFVIVLVVGWLCVELTELIYKQTSVICVSALSETRFCECASCEFCASCVCECLCVHLCSAPNCVSPVQPVISTFQLTSLNAHVLVCVCVWVDKPMGSGMCCLCACVFGECHDGDVKLLG